MSLEQQITELRDAIVHLTAAIKAQQVTPVTSAPVTEVHFGRFPPTVAEPVAAGPYPPTPAVPAPPVAAPVMPPPPSFEAAPAPAIPAAPFTDGKGLIAYVMAAYKDMGPVKGAGIQGVLTGMGLSNVNDVQPAQYAEFFAKVEALK